MSRARTLSLRLLLATACLVPFGCGGGGGGGTPPQTPSPTVSNPVPSAGSLSPSSVVAGAAAFTLNVNGSAFVSGATVRWNGSNRATNFISANQLTASIPATDVQAAGSVEVSVFNPPPGGGTSTALTFTIQQPPNPVPILTSISPSSIQVGSGEFLLVAEGNGFVPESVVRYAGSNLTTSFDSPTRLHALVGGTSGPGEVPIEVFNPPPQGGSSNQIIFEVESDISMLDVKASDLIYDPTRNLLYASVAGDSQNFANHVVVIDPSARSILNSVFVGNQPNPLAVSDDGQFLYVGRDVGLNVARINLTNLIIDLEFALGNDPDFGAMAAQDIEVMPGSPGTVAIARRRTFANPGHGGVAIYDNGVMRPVTTSSLVGSNAIEFGPSPAVLYGYDRETAEHGFRRMTIDASGVSIQDVTTGLLDQDTDIVFRGGRIYSTRGDVLDPTGPAVVGTFPGMVDPSATSVFPDSAAGQVFFLRRHLNEGLISRLWGFRISDFGSTGMLDLHGVSFESRDLVRWGTDGMAFVSPPGRIAILQLPGLVVAPPLQILSSQLPSTSPGKSYDFALNAFGGVSPMDWTLAVGSEPLPPGLALAPSGRIFGTTASVPQDQSFTFQVQVTDAASTPRTTAKEFTIQVRAGDLGRNDTCATATPISFGRIRASLSPFGDIDVYSFEAAAGTQISFETFARRLDLDGNPNTIDSYPDTIIELLSPDCVLIGFQDDLFGTLDSGFTGYNVLLSGKYYIRVRDFRGDGRPDMIYDLEILRLK